MRSTIGRLVLVAAALTAAGAYYYLHARPTTLVLTGVVTTNDTIVSAQLSGRIGRLLVKEGDSVARDQLLAVIAPDELRAESAYYAQTAEGAGSTVKGNESAVRFEARQTESQVLQAEAPLAAAQASERSGEADLERARLNFERMQGLMKAGVVSAGEYDQARTEYDATKARIASLGKQVESARAAVALAKTNAEQVAMRRSQLEASRHESAAALAQRTKADVRMKYSEICAPIDGVVNVRAAREGEVVSAAQPILTLVNLDDLWVRVDVEESYIDRLRLGDQLTVRLPSGVERPGTVFYRSVDGAFATQRDVSRRKRDIRTFEVRLRLDNQDRRLAIGMTAYVLLPLRT
jgi:multidrug resistance efflux pump